jgi:hypothetical protein
MEERGLRMTLSVKQVQNLGLEGSSSQLPTTAWNSVLIANIIYTFSLSPARVTYPLHRLHPSSPSAVCH